MNPQIGQWTFRVATVVAPFMVPVFLELQNQLRGRELDWWTLSEVAMGACISLIVAVFHIQRAATERAESTAEVVTGRDQDEDDRVEQPE